MRDLNTVHLNALRAVEAVGRLGSLQAAADELGVTIGAVSQQVIKAERQLGRTLFDRQPRGMVPTGAGSEFLEGLSAGFLTLSRAVSAVRRHDDTILTVSVAPVFAARWLVHRLGSFAERHPNIRLRIDATDRIVDPATSDVDVCIRVGRGDWPGVQSELLIEQKVFPLCAPAIAARLEKPADLFQHPAVIDGRAMFSWDVWLEKVGLGGRPLVTGHVFSEASLCLDAVIAGHGIMLAWQTLAAYPIRTGQLVIPFGPWVKTGLAHYFVTATNIPRRASVEAFRAWIRDELARDMADLETRFGGD